MLQLKFFHEIKTKDGIAFLQLAKQIFAEHDYVIFSGLECVQTGPLQVLVTAGRCTTLANHAIIYNTSSQVLDLNEIHSQPSNITTIPDGHHALLICYDEQKKHCFWQLVLELDVNKWDNPPTPAYIVINVFNVQGGVITEILDHYGPWIRVELGLGSGGGTGSCSGDLCLIGCPTDGSWEDGAADIFCDDTIADAVDKINELLNYLLPPPPGPLFALEFTPPPVSGYIANYSNLGPLTAGQLHDLIFNTDNITGITVNSDHFSNADKGTLDFYYAGVLTDTFDLGANFNEAEREGDQSYPPANSPGNYITVTHVGWYNGFPPYQIGSAQLNLQPLIVVGHNQVKLEHNYETNTDSTPDYHLYYDDAGRPVINTYTLNSINMGTTKWLSGVRYYGSGSSISVTLQIQDLFNKTYIANPVHYESPDGLVASTDIAWNDASASGYSNPPNYDDPWNYNANWQFENNIAVDRILVDVTASDPFGSGTPVQFSQNNVLINTYGNFSTDLHEYFVDENYRLQDGSYDTIPSNITGQWDSTQLLTNGQAQVFVDRLIYPHQDFTSGFQPTPQSADYSSFTGDQVYLRAFRDTSSPHNNGSLNIRGITYADIGTNLDIYIKLPSQTGWLDFSQPFNAATFTGSDGDGCLVSTQQNGDVLVLNWSSGTFTTANSGYMVIIRIVLHNLSPVILEMWDWGG